jgi:hypothetical protein
VNRAQAPDAINDVCAGVARARETAINSFKTSTTMCIDVPRHLQVTSFEIRDLRYKEEYRLKT